MLNSSTHYNFTVVWKTIQTTGNLRHVTEYGKAKNALLSKTVKLNEVKVPYTSP